MKTGASLNTWIRQVHRWTSIVFMLAVIASFVALARENPVVWVSYMPLPPLLLLVITGLYLFALPYAARWRGTRRGPVRPAGE
jgi:heme A synthase